MASSLGLGAAQFAENYYPGPLTGATGPTPAVPARAESRSQHASQVRPRCGRTWPVAVTSSMTSRTWATDVNDSRPRGVSNAEPMLMYLVKQVELAVRSHLDDLLRPDALTALQYTALTALEHHPDISSAQLARNAFVTAQTMAEMITTLEERGLIERHRDQVDRRRLAVALTADGQALLDRYRNKMTALESRMLEGFTKPQIAALRRSLQTCHANLTRDL